MEFRDGGFLFESREHIQGNVVNAPCQYRRQPLKVQAIQYKGTNQMEVCQFIGDSHQLGDGYIKMLSESRVDIAYISDWILREGSRPPYVLSEEEFLRTHGK